MIQLVSWSCLACIFSMASSSAIPNAASDFTVGVSETTTSMFEESKSLVSKISSNSATESSVQVGTGSSFATNEITEETPKSEEPSTEGVISTPDGPIFSNRNIPEPVYRGEMTITYQSTTANLKESMHNANQTENSIISESNKSLYYDLKTTTEYAINHVNDTELSHTIVSENATKSSPSTILITEEKNSQPFRDATVEQILSKNTTSNNGNTAIDVNESDGDNLKQKVETESKGISEIKSSQDIPSAIEHKAINSDFIGIKEAEISETSETEKLALKRNHEQKDNSSTVPTPVDFSESSPKYEEVLFVLKENEEHGENLKDVSSISEYEQMKHVEMANDQVISFTDQVTAHINDYLVDRIPIYATEIDNNSTRNPKRIQEEEEYEERYPEGRIRPIHPDPGYGNYPERDIVRPYRPDAPLHKYPYFRPTPDNRTPIIREDKDYTRPYRPDPDYQRVSFKPNYGSSKQNNMSSLKPISVFATSPKPYRPSFNRPYHPTSSFGRPYRPDYHRPASKPSDEYSVTKISEITGGSTLDSDVSEHSRADYDYTRLSESSPYTKIYNSDARPSAVKPDSAKPYRPSYDVEISMHSKPTSSDDSLSENRDSIKVSKPDMNTNRPSSFYPRPGFGNNYQTSETSVRPFSVGTVTSAKNLTRVEFIKADCFDNHMKVTMRFNGTFNGLVYSSGYASDSSCSYVNGSGRNHYEFYIRLNRCGTLGQQEVAEQRLRATARRRQERAQYLVNTVTVQYNPLIEEDIDEHFRVTCEYGYDFWKTVTFPVMNVESSAVKVRTGSPVVFTLPPPQCNMEIRSGFGPSGTRIAGPVNVGDPLTLVIHMKSESTGFDIVVKNCHAHNGAQKKMQLIDANGCVVQDKLVSPFRGVSSPDRSQTITLYSYLKAFRFTGSPALYIECDVHMCHGSCPPQRCYWRHLYKRSADEKTSEATTTTEETFVSESVSLFQALEVRHEEADSSYRSLRSTSGDDRENLLCLKSGGFATLLASLLLLLVITTFAAVCMSLRLRKMKKFIESPDGGQFVEFEGHIPRK